MLVLAFFGIDFLRVGEMTLKEPKSSLMPVEEIISKDSNVLEENGLLNELEHMSNASVMGLNDVGDNNAQLIEG